MQNGNSRICSLSDLFVLDFSCIEHDIHFNLSLRTCQLGGELVTSESPISPPGSRNATISYMCQRSVPLVLADMLQLVTRSDIAIKKRKITYFLKVE